MEENDEGQHLEESDGGRALPAHEQVVKVEGVVVGESFLVSSVGRRVQLRSATSASSQAPA